MNIDTLNTPEDTIRFNRLLIGVIFVLFCAAFVKTAWVTEDAYITFRSIDNFVHGFGPTWNISERVQTYTHPLWMLLLSFLYLFTGELYYTSIGLSLACTATALILIWRNLAVSRASAAAVLVMLIFSKAFMEYSTSGLENPLTHLLTAVFFWYYLEKPRATERGAVRLLALSFIAALAMLNRMDTILLYLPAIAAVFFQQRNWRAFAAICAGFLPFACWATFSLFYYGTPFPNTAYAKLNTGIAADEMMRQGLYYLKDTLTRDPLTVIAIVAAIPAALYPWRRAAEKLRLLPVAAGIVLYLLYVVKIGGDFMSGRFLTAPLLCAAVILSRCRLNPLAWAAIACAAVSIGLFSDQPPILSTAAYGTERQGIVNAHGISDERRAYYPHVGFLRSFSRTPFPDHEWAQTGRRARAYATDGHADIAMDHIKLLQVGTTIGLYGFYAGPHVHIVDELALCDPLLARLKADISDWRPGHYKRPLPAGYLQSLTSGVNHIKNPEIASLYSTLKHVVRGPLFDMDRLKAIWRLNTRRLKTPPGNAKTDIPVFQEPAHNAVARRLHAKLKETPHDPLRYTNLHYRFGRLYEAENDLASAGLEYRTALAINPFYGAALNAAAALNVRQGNIHKAITFYRRMSELAPQKPEIYYNIACLYSKQKALQTALAYLRKAAEKGYDNVTQLREDPDLASIRMLPAFEAVLNAVAGNAGGHDSPGADQ